LAFDFRPVGSGCDAGKTLVLVILVTQVVLLLVPLLLVTVVIAVACVVAIASATHHHPCDGPGDGDGVADPTAPPFELGLPAPGRHVRCLWVLFANVRSLVCVVAVFPLGWGSMLAYSVIAPCYYARQRPLFEF
jgi:hypothetical protein